MPSSVDHASLLGIRGSYSTPVAVMPGGVVTENWIVPHDLVLTGVSWTCTTAPTTAGAYTVAVTDETGTNNLLSTATQDLDATITANTVLDGTLTATVADRLLAQGDIVSFVFTSDNGDLVGTGLEQQLRYNQVL